MATIRQGYSDDFTIKNSKVGIGTSTANEKLEVLGGSRSQDIKVAGIATLTSYEGFQNKKTSYVDNIHVDSGESGTLSGEVVIGAGTTLSVGTGATTGQGCIKSLKVSNTFTPPIGGTNERPSAPKPGALFYNKDFRTIEYWDGNFWRQVDNITRRGRCVNGAGNNTGGASPSVNKTPHLEYVEISTLGNGIDFGELAQTTAQCSAYGTEIRGVWNGFGESSTTYDYMQYITITSTGNAVDFGNLTVDRRMSAACSSSTRGIIAGGKKGPASQDVIDYCEVGSLGDAVDFGNLSIARRLSNGAASSPTRAVFCGGSDPSVSIIDFVTISSKGNATQFGEAIWSGGYRAGCSNSIKGLWGTGSSGVNQKSVETQDFASGGNTVYFGDLTISRAGSDAASSQTRAMWFGGYDGSSYTNRIDYVTIATAGNGQDFGDLASAFAYGAGCSDSHGGLGGY